MHGIRTSAAGGGWGGDTPLLPPLQQEPVNRRRRRADEETESHSILPLDQSTNLPHPPPPTPALKAAPTFRLLPHVKASKGEDLFSIRALDGRPKHKREKEHVRCRRDCSHRQAAQTIVSGVITGRTLHRIHQRKWIAGKRSTK